MTALKKKKIWPAVEAGNIFAVVMVAAQNNTKKIKRK